MTLRELFSETIEKRGSRWCVLSKRSKSAHRRSFGCYRSRAAAVRRLGQVEFFKRQPK